MRKFEKISFEQFKKDISDDLELYNNYSLPRRKTKKAGAYDLNSLINYELLPGETVLIPTGIKYISPDDEIFLIVIRSSLGFKYGIKMRNQVGIIDADYYNNPQNEGHVLLKIENSSNEIFKINIGDAIAQGIFMKYYTVDNEEEITEERQGGIGSTGRS